MTPKEKVIAMAKSIAENSEDPQMADAAQWFLDNAERPIERLSAREQCAQAMEQDALYLRMTKR